MNRHGRDLIVQGARKVALSLPVALVVLGLAAASGASAREAGTGLAGELASQLLPIRGGNDAAINAARRVDLTISRAERVLVRVHVSGSADSAVQKLREAGMSVKATAEEPVPVVEGWVKATDLSSVASLGVSTAVAPIVGGGSDAGLATSEGVAAHRIPQALSSGASTGDGVDVGVISDSIGRVGGGIGASQASGDLPSTVTVLKEDLGSGTVDEGRAMAEIIFDGATGIDSILFASGTAAGPVDKADSIDQLVDNGAEVIADDIFWLVEPFFQDGVIAQAVDRARAAGVTYIASAGNRARQSWEGTYSGPAGPGFHDFDPGAGTDEIQTLTTVANGGFIQLAFQWDEPWGSAANDMDVQLVKADGGALPCAAQSGGEDDNPGVTKVSLEIVTWVNDCAGNIEVGLKINRFSGSLSPFMKYIVRGSFGTFAISEHATNSNTINPDAASAEGALAVAAVDALDSGLDTPRLYSSRGPVSKLFNDLGQRLLSPEVRQKPELAAADGVATTVPGFEQFFGTSAAVPSAASIAAILRSSNPAAPADEIERLMTDPANSIDCTESAAVPDPDCGAGFLLADLAFGALDTTPPDTTINTGPSGTIATNQATFNFSGSPTADTAKIQCRIDSEPFADCSSPKTFTSLTDGPHTAAFRAEDAAGNQDATPATRTFTVDTAVDPPPVDPPVDKPVGKAKIGKVKAKGPARVKKGKKATYEVKITNSGNAKAKGVRLKVKGGGISFSTWVGKVAVGKTKTVKLKLRPKKVGKVELTFKVTSSNAGAKKVEKNVKVKKKGKK